MQSLAAATRTATANGTGVDTAGFESVTILIDAGVITDGSHVLSLQDSPDNSTWTNTTALLGAAPTLATGAGNGGSASQSFGYSGGQRYIRVVSTVSGSPATGGVYGATVLLSHARHNDVQTTQE